MKHFAVIGNPIEHSFSPELHNWVFEKLGIQAHYKKIRVYKNTLQETIQRMHNGELDGINITIPHKESVLEYLDEINPRAAAIGAVNCIMKSGGRLIGNNTDWYGFTMALKGNNIELFGKEVILLGAGGAAKSILFALKQMGVSKIILLNRTVEKAEALTGEIIYSQPLSESAKVIKNDSIIINSTSVGMRSHQAPVNLGHIHNNQVLVDIIYTPLETTLVKFGKEVGAATINGLDMFIYQGLASLDLWFGENISEKVEVKDLRQYLTKYLAAP